MKKEYVPPRRVNYDAVLGNRKGLPMREGVPFMAKDEADKFLAQKQAEINKINRVLSNVELRERLKVTEGDLWAFEELRNGRVPRQSREMLGKLWKQIEYQLEKPNQKFDLAGALEIQVQTIQDDVAPGISVEGRTGTDREAITAEKEGS